MYNKYFMKLLSELRLREFIKHTKQLKKRINKMNEIILINLDCKECNNKEVWSIKEFEYVGDYPIECDKCHNDNMNITLNNK